MKTKLAFAVAAIGILFSIAPMGRAAAPIDKINLEGSWRFITDPANVGLQKGWQIPGYDASSWRYLTVPGRWEDQGITMANPNFYPQTATTPYNGYAWYRRAVNIPATWSGKSVYLNLGPVDDMDWTYVNGTLVGQVSTSSGQVSLIPRCYEIPASVIKFGKQNVIAVRVLDTGGRGGIEGPVSFTSGGPEPMPANLGTSEDQQAGDRVEILGRSVTVEDGGAVHLGTGEDEQARDKVGILGRSITVADGETVGDVTAIGNTVTVRGHVTGSAVAIGGDVNVQQRGRIDGDAVAIGGRVKRERGASIGGSAVSIGIGIPLGFFFRSFPLNSDWQTAVTLNPIWQTALTVAFLVVMAFLFVLLAALVAALFPGRLETVADGVLEKPGYSTLYGVCGLLLIVPVGVLLLVSILGIPLIAVEAILVPVAWVVGYIGAGLAVGRKLSDAVNRPVASAALAAAIGVLVLSLVRLVPVAGGILVGVLNLIGFGAVLMTGFGSDLDWLPRRFRKVPAGPTQQTQPPPADASPSE